MSTMESQITGVLIVCSTVCPGADQRKHQSSVLLAFVMGIHQWPVDSPHKGPIMQKMFPFDDVIITVATNALVLKHQAISIHSADKIFIVLGQFLTGIAFILNIIRE